MTSPGYDLWYWIDEKMDPTDIAAHCGVGIGIRRPPAEGGDMLPTEAEALRIGGLQLTRFSFAGTTPQARETLRHVPLLAVRRGTDPGGKDAIGIDSAVWTKDWDTPSPPAPQTPLPSPLQRTTATLATAARHNDKPRPRSPVPFVEDLLRRLGVPLARWVRYPTDTPEDASRGTTPEPREPISWTVAVLDTEFRESRQSPKRHGDRVVGVVRRTLKSQHLRIAKVRVERVRSYMMPWAITRAIVRAIEGEQAKVVVLPMSSGRWGTPDYLDEVLTEAGRLGVVVVVSTGRTSDNQTPASGAKNPGLDDTLSAALGADEVASHPDVLTVGPGDLDGRWFRRVGEGDPGRPPNRRASGIRGRMGPNVAVLGPGLLARTDSRFAGDGPPEQPPAEGDNRPTGSDPLDESSLAVGIVGGIVGLMLQVNPYLSPHEVKWLVQRTAFVPIRADVVRGVESGENATFDAEGLSFKAGAGMVHPFACVISAADPICQALISAGERSGPPEEAENILSLHAPMLAAWFRYYTASPTKMDDARRVYKKLAPLLARRLIHSLPARDELRWVARHLLAIFSHDTTHEWRTRNGHEPNHDALIRRLKRLGFTLWNDLLIHEEDRVNRALSDVGVSPDLVKQHLDHWEEHLQTGSPQPKESVEHKIRRSLFGEGIGSGSGVVGLNETTLAELLPKALSVW